MLIKKGEEHTEEFRPQTPTKTRRALWLKVREHCKHYPGAIEAIMRLADAHVAAERRAGARAVLKEMDREFALTVKDWAPIYSALRARLEEQG